MNCNCITETADRLKSRLLDADMNPPKNGEIDHVSCSSSVLQISTPTPTIQILIPFAVTWRVDGKVKKAKVTNMLASFCPFCGAPTKQETGQTDGKGEA